MRLPFVFIIVLLGISLCVDGYILYDIRSKITERLRRKVSVLYIISALLCYALLFAVMCMPVRKESDGILPVMWILYTYLSIYVSKIVYLVFSIIGRIAGIYIKRVKRKRKDYIARTGIVIACLTFMTMWTGVFYTRHHVETKRVEVFSDRLPDSFSGYKIVQFSDAHVGTWGTDTTFISRLVDRINSLNPDMIVFTGDLVNRETKEMEPFLPVLSRLKAKDGVFSILGNHDYGDYIDWKNPSDHRANNLLMAGWQRQIGWQLLNNERRMIIHGNDTIVLLGVENWGEPPFHQYGKLTDAYPLNRDSIYNLNDHRFKILLTHNPEHWVREVTKIGNVDLTLSGHTHAMQMMLSAGDWKWSPSGMRYPTWGGIYKADAKDGTPMNLYVNIGSGEVGMPSRLGTAYPEITELILKKK